MTKDKVGFFERHAEKQKGRDIYSHSDDALSTMLQIHSQSESVPFHMPGHKRNPKYTHLKGMQALDITEIDGFDNLHDAQGLLAQSMDKAAHLFGAKYTRYLVGGGSCGVLAAIRTATRFNRSIAIARNSHKSVYHAVELCALNPSYIMPEFFDEFGFFGSVLPQSVNSVLDVNPDIKTVVITSPTYEGVVSDIKSIAQICHSHGAVLIVDEAHGAHFGLSKHFPQSARKLGADIVINSLHKTLPSLTQTALLHVCTERVSIKDIDANLAIFESSSPSYPLLAAVDGCVNYLSAHGAQAAAEWGALIDKFHKKTEGLRLIKLFGAGGIKDGRMFMFDKSKLTIITADTAISGVDFAGILRYRFNIETEMSSEYYTLAMTGMGDEMDNILTLANAIHQIDEAVRERNGVTEVKLLELPKAEYIPNLARSIKSIPCAFEDAYGRVSAEYLWAYPPGSPIIVPGEQISAELIRFATRMYECGINVSSSYKNFPLSINVLSVDE